MSPSSFSGELPVAIGAPADDVKHQVPRLDVIEVGTTVQPTAVQLSIVQLMEFATQTVPHAEGASLTVLDRDRPHAVFSTASFATQVTSLEHEVAEGPGIMAAQSARTVRTDSLDSDHRWPKLRERVRPLKVYSAISVPLRTAPDSTVGVLTVYAHDRESFDERDAQLAEVVSGPTAVAVLNARLLAESERLTARWQAAVEDCRLIERALGIMMCRNGGSEQRAIALLHQMSDHEHRELAVMAQEIVDEAVGQAVAHYAHTRGTRTVD